MQVPVGVPEAVAVSEGRQDAIVGAMEHAPQPREKKSGSAQASQPGIKLNQPASEKKEEKKRKKGPKIAWRAPKKRP